MRTRLSLNGSWRQSVGGRLLRTVHVPSSYRPVGTACLERSLLPIRQEPGRRIFLCFDGIANTGEAAIGGESLGPMLPFVPYRFDITSLMTEGQPPALRVTIRDLGASFGYSPGWESYGGIIRDASLEIVDGGCIEDAHVRTRLADDLTSARCSVRLELRSFAREELSGIAAAELTLAGTSVGLPSRAELRLPPDGEQVTVSLDLEAAHVHLWSPDAPTLYRLSLTLAARDGTLIDARDIAVGFRDFRVDGRRFLLNGRPVFLKGVCRHDLWHEQGYTLTDAQRERDIRAIKALGANYIRLVHYPHHRGIIDLAERHGIMVSEEPGLWNIQVFAGNRSMMQQHKTDSLEVMERTVRRDRSSPAVIAWLLGNECHLDDLGLDFLRDAARRCRSLDPDRPVTFSHLYAKTLAEGKRPYVEAGLDYYDYHPYTPSVDTFDEVMRTFDDKPLVFGEWGGWFVRNNEGLMRMFGDAFARASVFGPSDSLHLNGIAYWEWADMRQYGRGRPGCISGILTEGLVDERRRRKRDFATMREIFAAIDSRGGPAAEVLPRTIVAQDLATYAPEGRVHSVDLGPLVEAASQTEAWGRIDPAHRACVAVATTLGAVSFRPAGVDGRPIALGEASADVSIPIGKRVRTFHFLGHVAVHAYPLAGQFGEPVAEYVIEFEDGSVEPIALLNGIHLARQSSLFEGTRIEPIAFDAPVVLRLEQDADFRLFEVRYYRHRPQRRAAVRMLRFRSEAAERFHPLLYAVAIETD